MASYDVCRIVRDSMLENAPDWNVLSLPLGDGGEGTARAISSACGGRMEKIKVKDPLFRDVDAEFAVLPDGSAVFEMASASGIELIAANERNPMFTSTCGTGQVLKHLICEKAVKNITIGIGGSATVDGGIGMLQALGVRFLDENSSPLPVPATGYDIARIKSIDTSLMDDVFRKANIKIASDVTNPLCGDDGAAAVFAPQKGADEEMVKLLESNLANFSKIAIKSGKADCNTFPGDGAAGGLGFALRNFLDAQSVSGAELVLEIVDFDRELKNADLVITGEGCSDFQTAHGKLPAIVAKHAKQQGVPVILLSGALGKDSHVLQETFDAVLSLSSSPCPLDEAIANTPKNLSRMAKAIVNLLKL